LYSVFSTVTFPFSSAAAVKGIAMLAMTIAPILAIGDKHKRMAFLPLPFDADLWFTLHGWVASP
jgi:hypothetical protein